MTISLLRRIWQRIHVESAATPPKQRLTGFEALEPRMVLSGFMAFYTPDYFSPPPGDFSQIDRGGAEIARPTVSFGHGNADNGQDYGSIALQPFFSGLDRPAVNGRFLDGHADEIWPAGTPFGSRIDSASSNVSPSTYIETGDDTSYEADGDSPSGVIIDVVPATPKTFTYVSISPLAIDRILADMRPVTFSASFSGLSPMGTMSAMSSGFRSLTERDYNPVSAGGAVERHEDAHEYTAAHGSSSDTSLALIARQATPGVERGTTNLTNEAALASQALGANALTVPSVDGSRTNGQSGIAADGSLDQQPDGLLELSGGELLKLKRKMAGTLADIEDSDLAKDRGEQHDESGVQAAPDPGRPFDPATVSDVTIRQTSIESQADDGLIEVLATDVTAVIASGEANDQAAANRQIVMEPAVAAYQAFETIVDGDARVAADAARLAGAVAMSGQPVVQAE